MKKSEWEDEYFLDEEGYYVAKEMLRGELFPEKCLRCGNQLIFVYAEKYSLFSGGQMMVTGLKIYGTECEVCNCCFIYDGEDV